MRDEILSEAPPTADSDKLNKTFKDLDPTVEKVKKNLEDMSKIKLEEDENMPSEDEAVEMKRELESYFDRGVGSAKEAVGIYLEKHPEDKKHETLLLRIAMAVFDEEVE
jgi:hypothetical protein